MQVELLNVGKGRVIDVFKVPNWVALQTENLQVGKLTARKLLQLVALQQQLADVPYVRASVDKFNLIVDGVYDVDLWQLFNKHQLRYVVLIHIQSL